MIAIKKKVSYIFSSALYAFGIFMLTRLIYYIITGENVLAATIGNIILIIYFVVTEKIEEHILSIIKSKPENNKTNILRKVLIIYLSSPPSFKSAMYFFYIFVTIYSALLAAAPDFPLQLPYDYLLSVRYGILILIAVDKFMEQISSDMAKL